MSEVERELGSEASTTVCPSCGADLSLEPGAVEGVLVAENCSNCFDPTPVETAAAAEPREFGSIVPDSLVVEPAPEPEPELAVVPEPEANDE